MLPAALLALSLLYAALLAAYRLGWRALPSQTWPPPQEPAEHISVVIAARDEALHIGPCLRSILAGNYPPQLFDICVADDGSTDATAAEVLRVQAELAAAQSPVRLRLLRIEPGGPDSQGLLPFGKKRALAAAIALASGPLIATTDADCVLPPDWLRSLGAALAEPGRVMAAGPVAMHRVAGLLGHFQALDLAGMVGIAGAGLHMGWQRMGNGANLAFRKQVYEEAGGYASHGLVASGDDMFLMQEVAARHPQGLVFVKNRAALVLTRPEATWAALGQQRLRWGSKNAALPEWRMRLALLLVLLTACGLLLLPVAAALLHGAGRQPPARLWAVAWVALAGSWLASAMGLLAVWSRQTAPVGHPRPGVGLVIAAVAGHAFALLL
ncbi:MAG TPA: glycosyltransferase, partial [Saprospiraceae bacterium]|nr:glycosyltransferase [Saprospiraceae bacterium]